MSIKAITRIMLALTTFLLLSSCHEQNQVINIDLETHGLSIEARNQTHPEYPVANFSLAKENHDLKVHPGDVIQFSFSYLYKGQKSAFISFPNEEKIELLPTYSNHVDWIVPNELEENTTIKAVSSALNSADGSYTLLEGGIVLIKQ